MLTISNNSTDGSDIYPEHLLSFEALEQHITGQLETLSATEKGDRFAHFVMRLVPQTEAGPNFEPPELNEKKAADEGVDLIAKSKDGSSALYIQSRLRIDRAEGIDGIISKFQAYTASRRSTLVREQYSFLDMEGPPHFMIVTLSPLAGILRRYDTKEFASKSFYRQLTAEKRISFVDGPIIWSIMRAAYLKLHQPPTNLELSLETPVINKDNIFLGVISSEELQRLYKQFNDALFFENVRDFLGVIRGEERTGRTTPNEQIVKTLTTEPDKMLERNNGIVFRADTVSVDDDRRKLSLTKGSIINGCQTTMCLVNFAQKVSYVQVKIIEKPSADSWDIATAANRQNPVSEIDLLLAPALRPQLAKRAAHRLGVQLQDGEKSVFQIIDQLYDQTVVYDETRILFIGLFSRSPNNVFNTNYTELMWDIIDRFTKGDPFGTKIYETLFSLQGAAGEGVEIAATTYTNPAYSSFFQRFYKSPTFAYQCFVAILALCGALNIDISKREPDTDKEFERMKGLLDSAQTLLDGRKARYLRFHTLAVKVWMQNMVPLGADEAEIQRDMNRLSKRVHFNNLFRLLAMESDLDEALKREEEEFNRRSGTVVQTD